MTRRESLGLLCAFPLLGLPFSGLVKTKPATIALNLKWDWAPGSGGPIEHFEVFVTKGDVVAGESNGTVTRVDGNLRSCEISLPKDGAERCRVSVRAVNAHGSSDLSTPITFNA
jgi:hypothetical protein